MEGGEGEGKESGEGGKESGEREGEGEGKESGGGEERVKKVEGGRRG